MKLRNQILLWQLVAGLLPLLLLLVVVNIYGQRLFVNRVNHEVRNELNHLKTQLQKKMQERDGVVTAIASSRALSDFAHELTDVTQRQIMTEAYQIKKNDLESLLLNMQPLIADDAVIRIIDEHGRTIIKVRFGETSLPIFESLEPYKLIEEEPDEGFTMLLSSMSSNENSHIYFPESEHDYSSESMLPMLDVVHPVIVNRHKIYVVLTSHGHQLDDLMALIPRLYQTRLSIIENREALPSRILYEDNETGFYSDPIPVNPDSIEERIPVMLASSKDDVIHYQGSDNYVIATEFHPYHDNFTSWFLVANINSASVSADIYLFRKGLLAASLVALILALFLTNRIACYLARPMTRIAENMKAYALGKPLRKSLTSSAEEVSNVEQSFTEMVGMLEETEAQKMQATNKLLQHEKLASIGEMAAGIGHELNNPLNNILSLTRLLKRKNLEDEQYQTDMNDLVDEAKRATSIVSGILDFARQTPPQLSQSSLWDIVLNSIQHVMHIAVERDMVIQNRVDQSTTLMIDQGQIEQVLVNLLTNAIHASDKHSSIEIESKIDDSICCIIISDYGSGIKPGVEQHMFDPFYTSKIVGKGSGLGLSVCLGIVEAHDGHISIKNHPQHQGVIAKVCLPKGTSE